MPCEHRNEYNTSIFCNKKHINVTWDDCVKCSFEEELENLRKEPYMTYVIPCCSCSKSKLVDNQRKCTKFGSILINVKDNDYCSYGKVEKD